MWGEFVLLGLCLVLFFIAEAVLQVKTAQKQNTSKISHTLEYEKFFFGLGKFLLRALI